MITGRQYFFIVTCTIFLTSCGVRRSAPVRAEEATSTEEMAKTTSELGAEDALRQRITAKALQFLGVDYQYGGMSSDGMDCSGLVSYVFSSAGIALPRASFQMATTGEPVRIEQVRKGDLLFFETGSRGAINHVGLVVEITPSQILFVHATTSRGVIISSLHLPYWKTRIVMARRIL